MRNEVEVARGGLATKRTEDQIRHLKRLCAALSSVSRAVAAAQTESSLLGKVCAAAAGPGGFPLVYIGMIDAATQRMSAVARAGEAAEYLDEANLTASIEPSVCNNLPGDASARYGLRSSISFPLLGGGTVIGVMGLYAPEAGFFGWEEAALAGEIAESVSRALESIEQNRRRRLLEEELRGSRERLELILDASTEGYWDWNLATGEARHSPHYEEMLGYAPGELAAGYGKWRQMLHPADRARAEMRHQAFIESSAATYSSEYRIRCKPGSYIWVLSRGKTVRRDSAGRPTRIVGTLTNVTGRKRSEEQYLEGQKLESVGRLAGGVAHDFNNVLTVINGYCDLLLKDLPETEPQWKYIEEIRLAGEQAASLTQQLFAISEKQRVRPQQPLRLNEEVTAFQKTLRRLVGEDIELAAELLASPDQVMGEAWQIDNILMNLALNARDAMPSGGKLTIGTLNFDLAQDGAAEGAARGPDGVGEGVIDGADTPPGPYVILQVTDTGAGMDEETLRHIFEPFFTTKGDVAGNGLGLSTVHAIVRQHGGFIRVHSEPGKGAAFQIYFPLSQGGAEEERERPADFTLRGSETVLIVEDQDKVRLIAAEALRSYGYSVISAANASEGLLMAELLAEPIHLLLTDVEMPGFNGQTFAEGVKKFRAETKVLYLLGYTDEIAGRAARLDPESAYVRKPFTPERLAAKVREVLDQQAANLRVLVVDDQAGVRTLSREILESAGHTVFLASDGREAMEALEENADVDLVITDLVMPNQEGIETIRKIHNRFPKVKIIAISGAFGGSLLDAARRLGAAATVMKPICPATLLKTIDRVFRPEATIAASPSKEPVKA